MNQFDANDVAQNKAMGVLAYLGFLFLVPLLAAKNSPYARFHTNQGLVLFIAELILGVVSMICAFIPFVGLIVSSLISIVSIVFMVIGIINACSGEPKKLPVIGEFTLLK